MYVGMATAIPTNMPINCARNCCLGDCFSSSPVLKSCGGARKQICRQAPQNPHLHHVPRLTCPCTTDGGGHEVGSHVAGRNQRKHELSDLSANCHGSECRETQQTKLRTKGIMIPSLTERRHLAHCTDGVYVGLSRCAHRNICKQEGQGEGNDGLKQAHWSQTSHKQITRHKAHITHQTLHDTRQTSYLPRRQAKKSRKDRCAAYGGHAQANDAPRCRYLQYGHGGHSRLQ